MGIGQTVFIPPKRCDVLIHHHMISVGNCLRMSMPEWRLTSHIFSAPSWSGRQMLTIKEAVAMAERTLNLLGVTWIYWDPAAQPLPTSSTAVLCRWRWRSPPATGGPPPTPARRCHPDCGRLRVGRLSMYRHLPNDKLISQMHVVLSVVPKIFLTFTTQNGSSQV